MQSHWQAYFFACSVFRYFFNQHTHEESLVTDPLLPTQSIEKAPLWAGESDPFERIGMYGWIGMYITGALLFLVILAHLFLAHVKPTGAITAHSIWVGLQSPLVRFLDLSLLALAVVHGFLGIRRIILDCEILRGRGQAWLTIIICLIGAVIVAFGLVLFSRLTSPAI